MALTAPMTSRCFAGVALDCSILDLGVRNHEPVPVDEHLHAASLDSIMGRSAISVVAAAFACLVHEMRIDVVGLERQRRVEDECDRKQGGLGQHGALPTLDGSGAGLERREVAKGKAPSKANTLLLIQRSACFSAHGERLAMHERSFSG